MVRLPDGEFPHRVESRVRPRFSLSNDCEISGPTAKLILDPFMIHELFPFVTEPALRSHPCRVVSATYRKLSPFRGANAGSNPAGDW